MTRKDLRNSEQEWRQTRHSNNHIAPKTPRWSLKVTTVLKLLATLAVIGGGVLLWESQQRCESINGASSHYCVD